MQILTAEQVRAWDAYTILHEPIASIDLMERAAQECVAWIKQQSSNLNGIKIFCGKGNNGGDGLTIARLLVSDGYSVSVFIVEFGKPGTCDFQANIERLHGIGFTDLHFIQDQSHFPPLSPIDIIVDCLIGSGLNKPLEGLYAQLVEHLNYNARTIIAIDVPSGLYIDASSVGNTIIKAHITLSFQCYKMALLAQENAPFIGKVFILDIGLLPGYLHTIQTDSDLIEKDMVQSIFRPRNRFAHKGTYGHALLIGGSYGKIGAIVMAAKACIRSGAGLTTAFIPKVGYNIMQAAVPEVMVITGDDEEEINSLPGDIEKYTAIGCGPGMGTAEVTKKMMSFVVRRNDKPMVIDADGLNCLAQEPGLLEHLPSHSILTPHPKEFDRLFGEHKNDFDRIKVAREKAKALDIIIILKSHHTLIALAGGGAFFNSTGNAGMAKGGSGDVLTGILTALLAQGYSPAEASILGVFIHGAAGDIVAKKLSEYAMIATDIIEALPEAFVSL